MSRPIDASELMLEIQACNWDSDQDKERAEDLVLGMPTLTPQNEPLTIEQLREMDGQPVYLIVDDGYEPLEMWALIDVPEKDHIALINNIGGMSAYYSDDDLERDHITAYRRPPERQEDT